MSSQFYQTKPYLFTICRNSSSDSYQIFQVDFESENLLVPVALSPHASFDSRFQVAQIGAYLLQWGPKISVDNRYQYNLREFDPNSADPLNGNLVQSGEWEQKKFWGYREYYSANKNEAEEITLIPMGTFVLNMIPAKGRGTYELWNFDPQLSDPLPAPYSGQGGFPLIKEGHCLLPIGNYVLDRFPNKNNFRLWSFDPQMHPPLALPAVQEGVLTEIQENSALVVLGDKILEWQTETLDYRLWDFDPESAEVLVGPVKTGRLPSEIGEGSVLTGFQPRIPINTAGVNTPGSLDFMRSKIKHVVYYMLESRSFDNVCGWLYESGEEGCHFIGSDQPFDGASTENYNYNFMGGDDNKKVYVSQYKEGKLSNEWDLKILNQDPFHDTSDALQQMFVDESGYWHKNAPDMGGFILNNANHQVMETFGPEQLPILNGLAKNFAVSDAWFSSVPGGTDVNRAFSVTGSAFDKLGTWEGGNAYKLWPDSPHRQSLWKVLWSQGITDWKIYNAVYWEQCIFTYQLYLKGQIPSVDQMESNFLASVEQFKKDALYGNLPAFSFLEPAWIAPTGSTSYHPGADVVPGEMALNDIYNAIKNGPKWNETLFIITFDKNNGIYDHVVPPYAKKPWPNDKNNGFEYDIMGARVPTIMVSPWIKEKSVIRAEGVTPFDSTSFAATLLNWFGVPKSLWCLGDRMDIAPTFEAVFQEDELRKTAPNLTPPYDKSFPKKD